ncbi:MAG TPA: DoxX family protein [Candidatus Angelobacter sp.]|nr:DoxX family protein [Candidatus Angelobacter sp.]
MHPQMEAEQQHEQAASIVAPLETNANWSLTLKIAFQFSFSYFVLFCLPFPLDMLPWPKLTAWYDALWMKIVPWVGLHWLHLAQPIIPISNNNGDNPYGYVKVLSFLVLSTLITIAWSVFDRKRKNYRTLHQWGRLYLRIFLGSTLLAYGAFKVIPAQFPPIKQWQYLETFGDVTPTVLLWIFMGASTSYTIFAGTVEMLGGILLFVPRLVTLGTLISIAAMTNVFILNMSYDVTVKLFSFHLMLLGIFLILPELRRLASFFVLNRPTKLATPELRSSRRWLNRGFLIGQIALGLIFAVYNLHAANLQLKSLTTGDLAAKPPLRGVWAVDEFILDGQVRPPLLTDSTRWQKAIIDSSSGIMVQSMDGKLVYLPGKIDPDKKTLELIKRRDAHWKANLNYAFPAPGSITMDGQLNGHRVHITLHQLDGKYLLNTRGFHWISETPFYR